jgi:hypothetical protein
VAGFFVVSEDFSVDFAEEEESVAQSSHKSASPRVALVEGEVEAEERLEEVLELLRGAEEAVTGAEEVNEVLRVVGGVEETEEEPLEDRKGAGPVDEDLIVPELRFSGWAGPFHSFPSSIVRIFCRYISAAFVLYFSRIGVFLLIPFSLQYCKNAALPPISIARNSRGFQESIVTLRTKLI